jgi:hypothetical protein
MSALTLVQAANREGISPLAQASMLAMAQREMIFRVLPFTTDVNLQRISYFSKEGTKAQFRGLNENFSIQPTDFDQLQYKIAPLGDKAQVDNVILKAKPNQMAIELQEKVFGVASAYNDKFIKGDESSDKKEFNGLQVISTQLPSSQTIDAGTTSGGDPLSLAVLDGAIEEVRDPNAIFMSASMYLKFSAAIRNQTISGNVNMTKDEFGDPLFEYNGLRLIKLKGEFNKDSILPYDEAAPNGGQLQTTSLYIARVGEEGLHGTQQAELQVTDFGRIDGEVYEETMIEWVAGAQLEHPLYMARLRGITNAAITG